jgi:hypothetical protein
MARKPNFNFERMERDKAKAAKTAEKAKAKSAKKSGAGADEGATVEPPATDTEI